MKSLPKNIIAFPSVDWNHNWERQHEIIFRLSQVISGKMYVHQPYGMINHNPAAIIRKISNRRKTESSVSPNKVAPNMEFIRGYYLPFHYNSLTDYINSRIVEKRTAVKFEESLIFATYVNGFSYSLFNRGKVKVLDLAQRRQKIKELSKEARELEKKAVATADVVFTDSLATADDYRKIRPDIFHLSTGVNLSGFENTSPPAEFQKKRKKFDLVAGYIGTDLALNAGDVKKLVESFPETLFVLAGPFVKQELLKLKSQENVWMPGSVPSDETPNWYTAFDIGLIPYQINERNNGIFPTKYLEYLAAATPVLSSALPDVKAIANEATFVYHNDEEMIHGFEILKSERIRLSEMAKSMAMEFSWDSIFDQYLEQIKAVL